MKFRCRNKLRIYKQILCLKVKNIRHTYTTETLRSIPKSEIKDIGEWWESPRFKNIKRIYTAEDVAKHRGTLARSKVKYASSIQAQKLFEEVENRFKKKLFLHTLGIIDPIQMSQLARCETIGAAYISR